MLPAGRQELLKGPRRPILPAEPSLPLREQVLLEEEQHRLPHQLLVLAARETVAFVEGNAARRRHGLHRLFPALPRLTLPDPCRDHPRYTAR